MNADVARRAGVKTGDRVRLRNQDGVTSLPVKVLATERIRPDCVYIVHGFGHNAKRLHAGVREGGERRAARHPLRDRPADGRHRDERQLREPRAGELTMARYGMAIDTRTCVGCMDCVVACKTENQVPEGFNRDWIAYETRGAFPSLQMEIRSERCNHCDDPPCVGCCPTGASHVDPFGKIVLVTHARVHRLQGLHRLVPVRRALRPPGGLRRQVHVLHPPGEGGEGPGVRVGVPDPLHDVRGPRRSEQRHQATAGLAEEPPGEARGGHRAADLLPDVRGTSLKVECTALKRCATRTHCVARPFRAGLRQQAPQAIGTVRSTDNR